MTNDTKIKFAVVGAGHIGKRHAEMIRRDREGELVAMVDIRTKEECGAQDFDVPFLTVLKNFSQVDYHLMWSIFVPLMDCTLNSL